MSENGEGSISGSNTAVMDRPDTLPATPPEQALTVEPVAEPVRVSQRIIDDVNSVVSRAEFPRKAVIPESPHQRIRKDTLARLAGMAPDQQGWDAVKTALKSYDAEVGMGKDAAAGKDVPHEQYKREYRRLRQKLYQPFVASALDAKSQALDETISVRQGEHSSEISQLQSGQKVEWSALHNPLLMREAARDDVLRRMVIKEAGSRIDTTVSDPVDAAYHKLHLVKAIYDQAKAVPSVDGGVTADWARRAIRAEQRKSVLAMLSTPEGTAQAVAKAQEWISQEKTADHLPADVNNSRAELGRAILRIKAEQEKKAAKKASAVATAQEQEKLANDPRREQFQAGLEVAQREIDNNSVTSTSMDPLRPSEPGSINAPRMSHVPEGYVSPQPVVETPVASVVGEPVIKKVEPVPAVVPEGYDYVNGPMQRDIAAHVKQDAESGRTAELEERRKKINDQLAVFLKEHPAEPGVKGRLKGFARRAATVAILAGIPFIAGVEVGKNIADDDQRAVGQTSEQVTPQEMPSEVGIGPEKDGVVPIDVSLLTSTEPGAGIGTAPEATYLIPDYQSGSDTTKVAPDGGGSFVGNGPETATGAGSPVSDGGATIGGEITGDGTGIVEAGSGGEVDSGTTHTFVQGETFGGVLSGSTDAETINAWLNAPENQQQLRDTIKANIGKPGFPATAAEVDAVYRQIADGTMAPEAGWSMLNFAQAGETYTIAPKTATETPQVVSTSSIGESAVGGDVGVENVAEEPPAQELGKPTSTSFGRRLAGFFRRS